MKGERRWRVCIFSYYRHVSAICWYGLLILTGILSWEGVTLAGTLGLSGNWQYQHTGNGEDCDSYQQNYNLDFGHEMTEAMTLSGSVRYNNNWNEGRVTETLYPTLDFRVSNDIFRLDFSGTATERMNSEGPDQSDRSWDARWDSAWSRDWWPEFRLRYGEGLSWDDQTPHVVDKDSSQMGLDIDWETAWDIIPAKTFYSYYRNEGTDKVTSLDDTNESHYARLQLGRSFWANRFAFSFSQQYSMNHQESEGPIGTPRPRTISKCMAGEDDTPDEDTLPDNLELIDHDYETSALVIEPDEDLTMNIGVKVDSQQIDLFYFYTVEDLSPADRDFRWDLWVSEDGDEWKRKAIDLTSIYNLSFHRFEIDIPGVKANYLKLVTKPTLANAVSFSEVEVMRRAVSEKEERDFENYMTDLGLGFRLTTDLNLNYSLSLEKSKSDSDYNEDRSQDRRTQAGTLAWTPSPYFSPSLNVSECQQNNNGDNETRQPDTLTRSYSFSITSAPLPTLDLSSSVTRSENYEDDKKISTTDSYCLYTTAVLFPDLDSSLDITYSTTDDEEQDEDTRTFGARTYLTARLSPKLTADLTGEYNKSMGETDSVSKDAVLTLNWRPSDIFSLRGSANYTWEEDEACRSNYTVAMSVVPSDKTQVNLNYSYADSTSTTENYGISCNWTINRIFSMNLNGSYQIKEDEKPWSISGQLAVRF